MSTQMQPVPSVSPPVSVSQLLAEAVQALINLTEEEFYSSVTSEDAQQLATVRAALSTIVGEDECHLLAPLELFIGNLIKNHEFEPNPRIPHESSLLHGVEDACGADEPGQETDTPIAINLDYKPDVSKEGVGLRPIRGIASIYDAAEPEQTADVPIAINVDYEDKVPQQPIGLRPMRRTTDTYDDSEAENIPDMFSEGSTEL